MTYIFVLYCVAGCDFQPPHRIHSAFDTIERCEQVKRTVWSCERTTYTQRIFSRGLTWRRGSVTPNKERGPVASPPNRTSVIRGVSMRNSHSRAAQRRRD